MALHIDSGKQQVQLMKLLAETYQVNQLQLIASSVELDPAQVNWNGPLINVTQSLVGYANSRWQIDLLIDAAYTTNKDNARLRDFAIAVGLLQPTDQPLPPNAGAEQAVRAMLESTYFDLSILQAVIPKAIDAAQAVCRIRIPVRLNNKSSSVYGTGFLLAPNLLLTCYHVVQPLIDGTVDNNGVVVPLDGGAVDPGLMDLEFGYQTNDQGEVIALPPSKLVATGWLLDSSPYAVLDYALLRVAGEPGNTLREKSTTPRGWLTADLSYQFKANDPFYILEHPILQSDPSQGAPLKLTMPQHAVVGTLGAPLPTRVLYAADTEGGASGSPCFNQQFELVAMHHAWKDSTQNEGIPIKTILSTLATKPTVKAVLDAAGVALPQ